MGKLTSDEMLSIHAGETYGSVIYAGGALLMASGSEIMSIGIEAAVLCPPVGIAFAIGGLAEMAWGAYLLTK